MTDLPPVDDFAAAKAVYDQLSELSKDRQQRVLRWVSESLGLLMAGTPSPGTTDAAGAASNALASVHESHSAQGAHHTSAPVPDIRTFVAQKSPASDNQFAAVVAYYYRFVASEGDRRETIGGAILQEAARLAGRRRLSNPRQTLANATNMGYLDNQGRGEFAINSVGENLVALTMPAAGTNSSNAGLGQNSSAPVRRKRQRKSAQPKKKPAAKPKRKA